MISQSVVSYTNFIFLVLLCLGTETENPSNSEAE